MKEYIKNNHRISEIKGVYYVKSLISKYIRKFKTITEVNNYIDLKNFNKIKKWEDWNSNQKHKNTQPKKRGVKKLLFHNQKNIS